MEFTEAVEEILVTEHMRSRKEASELIKRFPNIMVNAIMAGRGRGRDYRAAAIALEMAESDTESSEVDNG